MPFGRNQTPRGERKAGLFSKAAAGRGQGRSGSRGWLALFGSGEGRGAGVGGRKGVATGSKFGGLAETTSNRNTRRSGRHGAAHAGGGGPFALLTGRGGNNRRVTDSLTGFERRAEVKVRWNRFTRRLWRRSRGAIVGLTAVACAALLTTGVLSLLGQAERSDKLRIQAIELRGAEHLTVIDVRALTGINPGDNLLAVNLDRALDQLLTHPWVDRAAIEKRAPDTLVVEVHEFKPAGTVLLESVYYFDRDGFAFKALEPGETAIAPIVTGLDREAYTRGGAAVRDRLREALTVIAAWKRSGLDRRFALSELNLGEGDDVRFIGRDGAVLELNRTAIDEQLVRVAAVTREAEGRSSRVAFLHAGAGASIDRVTARLVPIAAAGPTGPAGANDSTDFTDAKGAGAAQSGSTGPGDTGSPGGTVRGHDGKPQQP
jgi:hypothetical protein